jgi:hypothetical protein
VALYFKFTEYSLDDACFALMSDILVAFLSWWAKENENGSIGVKWTEELIPASVTKTEQLV